MSLPVDESSVRSIASSAARQEAREIMEPLRSDMVEIKTSNKFVTETLKSVAEKLDKHFEKSHENQVEQQKTIGRVTALEERVGNNTMDIIELKGATAGLKAVSEDIAEIKESQKTVGGRWWQLAIAAGGAFIAAVFGIVQLYLHAQGAGH